MQVIYSEREKELLTSLRAGSEEAFDALYSVYSRQLYSNIYRMVRCPDTARELLQDVFVRVWEKRDQINPELSFRAYLFQISRHLVYNFFRRKNIDLKVKQYLTSIGTELHNQLEEKIIYEETKQQIEELISQLPPQRRAIYTMCKLEGKSYHEVSRLLGISESTINDHIVKATRFLKGKFQEAPASGLSIIAAFLLARLS